MTARDLANRMQKRADTVEAAFLQSSRGLATSAVAYTKQRMTEEIYSVPEDTVLRRPRSGGRPRVVKLWRRTGHLRRSEQALVPNAYTVRVVNTAAYAEPRHEAGKPGRRNINPARVSHWRDDLIKTFRPIVLDVRRQTVLDLLKGSRI